MGEDVTRPQWQTRWQEWRSDRRVAAAVLACVALAAGAAWVRTRSSGSARLPPPAPVAAHAGSGTGATSSVPVTWLVVDVVGAVRRTGIVRVRAGARVVDAITAAGGALPEAALDRLNLAAPVADGARIAVPRVGGDAPGLDPAAVTGPAHGASAGPQSGPVNLNTATADELDGLPGIGPATAAAIVHDRDTHGPFASVDDLARVRGIGKAKLEQLRDLVTV